MWKSVKMSFITKSSSESWNSQRLIEICHWNRKRDVLIFLFFIVICLLCFFIVIYLLYKIFKNNKRFKFVSHVLHFINNANLILCIALNRKSLKLYFILYSLYYNRYLIKKSPSNIRYRIHRNRNSTTNKSPWRHIKMHINLHINSLTDSYTSQFQFLIKTY